MAPSLVLVASCLVAQTSDGFVPPGTSKQPPPPPTVEKDAVEKEAVEKDAVEKDAVEKDAVEKDAVEKDAVGKATEEKSAEKTAVEKKPVEEAVVDKQSSEPLAPVQHRAPRKLPELVLTEILVPARNESTPGQSVSLLDAIKRSIGGASRVDVVKAYWAHVVVIGNENVCQDALSRVERLENEATGRAEGSFLAELAAAVASAKAQLREAQLARAESWHRLATYLGNASAPAAPADHPHVGGYRTAFDQLYAKRTPPPELRLLDRTMPLLHRCIQTRAEAVRASKESLDAADAALRQENITGGQWLYHLAAYRDQRLAFLREVEKYNTQIVDYAAGVSGTGRDARSFVALLIQTADTPAAGRLLPKPQPQTKAPAKFVPSGNVRPVGGSGPDGPPARAKGGEKSILRSSTKLPPGKYDPQVRPAEFRKTVPANQPSSQTSHYRGAAAPGAQASQRFAVLANLPREQQTRRLAGMLYGSRTNPLEITVRATTLQECLRGVTAPADRRRVIAAYLSAGERASQFAAAAVRHQQIDAIRLTETAPLEEVTSHAKQTAAQADIDLARVQLMNDCFGLTTASRRPPSEAWLWPSTIPQAGRVAVGQPLFGQTPGTKQQQAMIAASYELLQQRAVAVIAADAARSAAQGLLSQGRGRLIDMHQWIDREHQETLRFLGVLTRYNLAHADVTLAVPPPDARQGELGRRLLGWVGFER